MATTILEYADPPNAPGCEYAVLVNNLGTTSRMEMGVVLHAVGRHLGRDRGLKVSRMWCGTYMTATDMAGFSFSIMRLNARRREFLDAPTWVTLSLQDVLKDRRFSWREVGLEGRWSGRQVGGKGRGGGRVSITIFGDCRSGNLIAPGDSEAKEVETVWYLF